MGLIASKEGLKIVDKARLAKGWARQAPIWYQEANVSLPTLKRFLAGRKSISQECFQGISEALGVDWKKLVDWEKSCKNLVDDYSIAQIYPEEDCNEMPDVNILYGREKELENLKQLILQNKPRPRVVVLCGQAGIGKTALAAKLTEEVKSDFEYFSWRSLNYSPPQTLSEMLSGLIKFISGEENYSLSRNVDSLIAELLKIFSERCVLLVLDGWENILQILRTQSDEASRIDYEKYGELLRLLGERKHKSCVLITTQEEPKELSSLQDSSFVNITRLLGLELEAGLEILNAKKLIFRTQQAEQLINDYRGNPLVLNHICEHIKKVFLGDVTQYETNYTTLYPLNFETAIKKNCEGLPNLETEILRIIATESTPIEYEQLKLQIHNTSKTANSDLQNSLSLLFERSLIEINSQGSRIFYNLQPITRKCVRKLYEINYPN
jgi:transcriptional regulator with XRE-family HTH domain